MKTTSMVKSAVIQRKYFKILFPTLIAVLILLPIDSSFGNTGVFFGVGNQVIPIKNDEIQLVKEDVLIRLSIEEDNGIYGIPFIPWSHVTAVFFLKNTTDKTVQIQMGFPFLDLQGFGDEKMVFDNLNFKVNSDGKEIDATLKEGLIEEELDPEGLFKKVFAWEDSFEPGQQKKVTVTYKLLMGVASANSSFREFNSVGRKYYELDKLFPVVNYSFGYLTGTAYTWKGPLEKAVFQFEAEDFLNKLEGKEFTENFDFENNRLSRPVFMEKISPAGYQKEGTTYRWVFSGTVPEDGLSVNFACLFIPAKPGELKTFVDHAAPSLEEASQEEFFSILKQYYGYYSSGNDPDNDFSRGYFQGVWAVKGSNKLIFEEDEEKIKKISKDFAKLIEGR